MIEIPYEALTVGDHFLYYQRTAPNGIVGHAYKIMVIGTVRNKDHRGFIQFDGVFGVQHDYYTENFMDIGEWDGSQLYIDGFGDRTLFVLSEDEVLNHILMETI